MNGLMLLRVIGLIALVVGATTAINALVSTRQRTAPLPFALLSLWALSPFMACAVAAVRSPRWPVPARITLYSVMVVVAAGAVPFYGTNALRPAGAAAAVFLVVPALSWLFIAAIVVAIVVLVIPRRPPHDRTDQ